MNVLDQLISLGYTLTPEGDSIHCCWSGSGSPPESVRGILAELKARKDEALLVLSTIPIPDTNPQDFVVWAEGDAHRIGKIVDEVERDDALAAFERRCSIFDALPDEVKDRALGVKP